MRSDFSGLRAGDTVTLSLTTVVKTVNLDGSIGINDNQGFGIALSDSFGFVVTDVNRPLKVGDTVMSSLDGNVKYTVDAVGSDGKTILVKSVLGPHLFLLYKGQYKQGG